MLPVVCLPEHRSQSACAAIAMPDGVHIDPACPGRAVWIYETEGAWISRAAVIPFDTALALQDVLGCTAAREFLRIGLDEARQIAAALDAATGAFFAADEMAGHLPEKTE